MFDLGRNTQVIVKKQLESQCEGLLDLINMYKTGARSTSKNEFVRGLSYYSSSISEEGEQKKLLNFLQQLEQFQPLKFIINSIKIHLEEYNKCIKEPHTPADNTSESVYFQISETQAPVTYKYPKSYYNLTKDKTIVDALSALFNDYYSNNFFRGHWNRHHRQLAKEIEDFLKDVPRSVAEVKEHLIATRDRIASGNPSKAAGNSSMLRRLNYAIDKILTDQIVKNKDTDSFKI